jgi:hypothetical protein
MTALQAQRVIALSECRLPVFGAAQNFIRNMVRYAQAPEVAILSPNEAKAIEGYAWKFREQLRAMGKSQLVPDGNPYAEQKAEQFELKL